MGWSGWKNLGGNYKITITMKCKSYDGSNVYQGDEGELLKNVFTINVIDGVASTDLLGSPTSTDFLDNIGDSLDVYANYIGHRLLYVSSIDIEEI